MPYNLTRTAIEIVNQHFEALQGDVVTFKTTHPQRLAFLLRQALAAAKALDIPKPTYKFHVNAGEVIAYPNTFGAEEFNPEKVTVTRSDIKNALELVSQLLLMPPTCANQYQNLTLTQTELEGLTDWCVSHHLTIEKHRDNGYVIRPAADTE